MNDQGIGEVSLKFLEDGFEVCFKVYKTRALKVAVHCARSPYIFHIPLFNRR